MNFFTDSETSFTVNPKPVNSVNQIPPSSVILSLHVSTSLSSAAVCLPVSVCDCDKKLLVVGRLHLKKTEINTETTPKVVFGSLA